MIDVSATHLRHPLACKKFIMEFEEMHAYASTPSSGGSTNNRRLEPFELFSRYTAVRSIARGTYGYVIAARDDTLVEEWNRMTDEERNGAEDDGLDSSTRYDMKTLVAIKKVPQLFDTGNPRIWLCAAREVQMLMHFKHENVMSARDVFIPLGPEHLTSAAAIRARSEMFEDVYVVMDHKDMTLREVFRRAGCPSEDGAEPQRCKHTGEVLCALSRDYRQFLLYQLLRGVGYLHRCRVMHRDLKPENVLVDYNYRCCICDFGQAKDLALGTPTGASGEPSNDDERADDGRPVSSPQVEETIFDNCTQWYAAPETLTLIPEDSGASGFLGDDVLHSADVWSLGAIAAEMLIGRPLFWTRHGGGFSQLRAITEVRGALTQADTDALTLGRHEEDKKAYVRELSSVSATKRRHVDFKTFLRDHCPLNDTQDDELDLIDQLLRYDPKARPTCEAAIAHPFFVDAGYEASVDPESSARPLVTVKKRDIPDATAARRLFWDMFLKCHGQVQELMDILQTKESASGSGNGQQRVVSSASFCTTADAATGSNARSSEFASADLQRSPVEQQQHLPEGRPESLEESHERESHRPPISGE